MKTRTWFGVVFGTISVCLLLGSPVALAGKGAGANKLEGAWVAKVVGAPSQWSYVLVPDPSGRRAALAGSVDVGFSVAGLFGPTDRTSILMANLVMTGPDHGVFNSVWFGLKELPETSPITDVVVWIGTSQGTFTFTAPGKISVVHNFAFYWPSADSDGDGLPDANAEPAYEVQILSEDTRLMPPE